MRIVKGAAALLTDNRVCGRGFSWSANANHGPFYWNNNTDANTNTNIGASLSYVNFVLSWMVQAVKQLRLLSKMDKAVYQRKAHERGCKT